jgi:hypothetical protein
MQSQSTLGTVTYRTGYRTAIDKNLLAKILTTGKISLIYYRIYEWGRILIWSRSRIWILPQVLHMLENLNFLKYFYLQQAWPVYRSHHCHRCHNFQCFGQHIENLE